MKTIGITGASGFIAGHVAEECLGRGYKVLGLDHIKKDAEHYPAGVEIFLGDMRDPAAMAEFAAHTDGIIHLGGVLGTQECINNPLPAVDSNVKGGLNFLEACNQYNLPGVNICVGNWQMNNPYSISKNMVERLCVMFNSYRGGRINQVRAVNAYGARQVAAPPYGTSKVRKITPAFICRALSEQPIEVYGDGEQVSDMVYVVDLAKALVNALEKADQGIVFDRVVEIGSVEHTTVNSVAETVTRIAHEHFDKEKVEIVHLPMRPGEIPGAKVTADVSTLELVDIEPRELTPLYEGILNTMNYFTEAEGTAWAKPSRP